MMSATPARQIELDAKDWNSVADFSGALLAAIGAPEWHGHSINAFLDSMIWHDTINSVQPPYTIQIRNASGLAANIVDEIELLKRCISEARAEFRSRRGSDIDVQLEVLP